MNAQPSVSVICLCYNQATFVADAIQSVFTQDHSNVELIVVDDGSKDGSKEIIKDQLKNLQSQFIDLKENVGNCVAFNHGLKEAKGEFIIDLAADDVLYPNRISEGLRFFKHDIGVHFCDVMLFNEKGENIRTHYRRNKEGILLERVPEGDIYEQLIAKYFISPPAMMIRRTVLDELDGYDEKLSYEDFDFWIRSSRNWRYSFSDQVLVGKRVVTNSFSSKQFKWRTNHQKTTLEVCRKIKNLNRSKAENSALRKRCWYEIRQCVKQGNLELIPSFLSLI